MPTKIAARTAPPSEHTAVDHDDDHDGVRPTWDQVTTDAMRVGIVPPLALAALLLVLKIVFYTKMGPNLGP